MVLGYGAWLLLGISTEVPLTLFQIALSTCTVKLMSEQIAGKIGSRIKQLGAWWQN